MKTKIMIIGNRLWEIRKSVYKKSQMSLRDMLVLALLEYDQILNANNAVATSVWKICE